MEWTTFPSKYAPTATAMEGTLQDLFVMLRDAGPYKTKTLCKWVKLARFGDKRSDGNSLRNNANVLAITGVEGDYDGEVIQPEEAIQKLEAAQIRAIVYTSASSTPERPRWRVIAPCSKEMPKEWRDILLSRINGVLGGHLANESFTLSQSYYFGQVEGVEYRVLATFDDLEDGHCIDDLPELDDIAIGKKGAPAPAEDAPYSQDTIAKKVQELGRKLRTGDGRRDLLKSHIASASGRGIRSESDLMTLVHGVAAQFFDPADPFDPKDVGEIVGWATGRDKAAAADAARMVGGLLVNGGQGNTKKQRLTLDQFALNGQSAAMRKQMLQDKHILGKLALLGQCTVFFTERNGGKTLLTLWLLIQSIRQGVVRAEDVYYINSDDTHKGLVEKIEFAEQSGFKMLSDGYGGFKNDTLTEILDDLCETDNAHGKILILDTLKKFVEVMKVDKATEFMKKIRTFVLKGGSVIMLAHVNKHRGEDGKLVFKGTTDVVDDADCYYIMDKAKQGDKTIVTFENRKARGDVVEKVIYSFERLSDCGQTYADLLGTVQEVSEDAFKAARRGEMVAEMVTSNHKIIAATLEAIEGGTTKRTELVDSVHAETGESKKRVLQVLDQHTGTNFLEGHRWRLEKGDKNAKIYVPLMGF